MYMLMEQIMPLFVFLMFGVVLFLIGKNIVTWHQNNQAPRLTVQAKVVSRRQNMMRNSATVAGDLNECIRRSSKILYTSVSSGFSGLLLRSVFSLNQ